MPYRWPGGPWGSHITEARQPGEHMWDIRVGSQSEGPGEAQQQGAKAPAQWIWKGVAGHEETPAQQLLAATIQVVEEPPTQGWD